MRSLQLHVQPRGASVAMRGILQETQELFAGDYKESSQSMKKLFTNNSKLISADSIQ